MPPFSVNPHHSESSGGRVRSVCPHALISPPPPAPPLFYAQSIWNVHVESIKAELVRNAVKHVGCGPGPRRANTESLHRNRHEAQSAALTSHEETGDSRWRSCDRVCVRAFTSLHSPRVSTVTILSLHRRWQVWLSASRPELKSRHSMHSLQQRTAGST